MADAYGTTFWYALGLVAITLLPKRKPAPVEDDADAQAAPEPLVLHRRTALTVVRAARRPKRRRSPAR